MKIQIGEIKMNEVTNQRDFQMLDNKTRRFLIPCLREYGEEFVRMIKDTYKIAVGIGDIIVQKRGFKHEKHLFVLLDSSIAHDYFINFLNYIKQHEAYQADYVYGSIMTSTYHMVIIKFPERLYSSFETFKIGDYSKMFNKDDIDKFFSEHPRYRRILIKDESYKIKFAQELNERFGSSIKPSDIQGELDLPPTEETEIFNTHLK